MPILIAPAVIGLNDVKVDRRIVLKENVKQTDPRVSDRGDNSERSSDTIAAMECAVGVKTFCQHKKRTNRDKCGTINFFVPTRSPEPLSIGKLYFFT